MTALAVLAGAVALAVAEIPTVYLWLAWALMALVLGVIVAYVRSRSDSDGGPLGEDMSWLVGVKDDALVDFHAQLADRSGDVHSGTGWGAR